MSDHSIYCEEGQVLADVAQTPGFPFLRLHPALIDASRMNEISPSDETLLLTMHLQGNQLLVISNKSAVVYLVPQMKTRLQRAGRVGLKVGIGMIPIVGQLLDAGESLLQPVGWIKAGKQRKEDRLREAEGMPTNEEINSVAWDFSDRDTLTLVQIYKEKILLQNGFKWQTLFKVPLDKPGEKTVIAVEEKGIRVTVGRKEAMALYLDKSWEPVKIAEILVDHNRQGFEAMGCTVDIADQKITFRKC